ncbi:MAG: CehA/McbA family metallohydrolase [Clostridia bacterium]|nr:CehA/McbA family metallohydrolase [Clostridia bacterium]
MIRQQAFQNTGRKMLKGGLHCHTTRSDGKISPEETIQMHYDNGYDFLSLTDHNIYNYTNFAPGFPITVIPGVEADVTFHYGSPYTRRCYHTVCLGPAKEDGNGFEQDEKIRIKNVYSHLDGPQPEVIEGYQAFLDDVHSKGNLTIYCHPEWSCTPARYFEMQEGNIAMEVWNTTCVYSDDVDRDAAYWDEVLSTGKIIYGVATDDGHRKEWYCKGWVMVNAENNINAILEALKNGAFYSSCGPEIYDFYVDGETAVVECSPAAKIRLHTDKYQPIVKRSEDGSMTRAEFRIAGYDYARITIADKEGRYAWTNPIFLNRKKFGLED